MADLGKRLRDLRKSKKLSLREVHRRTGLHLSTISRYENGVRQPSLQILRELAALYEVPPSYLIGGTEDSDDLPFEVHLLASRLKNRPDLTALLELADRLSPAEVEALVAFLRQHDADHR